MSHKTSPRPTIVFFTLFSAFEFNKILLPDQRRIQWHAWLQLSVYRIHEDFTQSILSDFRGGRAFSIFIWRRTNGRRTLPAAPLRPPAPAVPPAARAQLDERPQRTDFFPRPLSHVLSVQSQRRGLGRHAL